MKQIKIFNQPNTRTLQDSVNRWIAENDKVIVSQILQSEAPGTTSEDGEAWAMTITVVYGTDTPATTG